MADWANICEAVAAAVGSSGAVLAWYTRFLESRMRALILENAVSLKDFERVENEVDNLQRVQAEFATIAVELEGLKRGAERLEDTVREQADIHRQQLTGAINAMREDVKERFELIRALIASR